MDDIVTARLNLRPMTLAVVEAAMHDREQLPALLGAQIPDAWPLDDLASILPMLADLFAHDTLAVKRTRLVVRHDDQQLIGDVGLIRKGEQLWELGYSVLPEYWRQGYGFEAAQGLINWAACQPDKPRIIAKCDDDNIGSIRILEKLGMRQTAHVSYLLLWELPRHDAD